MSMHNWMYDELQHCGVDYSEQTEADDYDKKHSAIRDFDQEFKSMLEFLELADTGKMDIIDLGCGTGAASIPAAHHFRKVFAVDISKVMLKTIERKASNLNLKNIEIIQSGFLSYIHKSSPADLIISKAAFHHLPDFWKQIALLNIFSMLKPGGVFYLFDVVYHFEPEEYESRIKSWLALYEQKAGEDLMREFILHIRDEYSTFHWILKNMLEKAGFTVEKYRTIDGFLTEYKCVKP